MVHLAALSALRGLTPALPKYRFNTSVLPNILIAVTGKKEKLPLSVTHPELAKEADGWDPNTLTAGSHKKLKWICREGHSFEAIVKNRSAGSGCRTCSVTAPRVMGLPITTTHPNIAAEADGWDPGNMGAGSTKKLGWKCRDGHTWNAVVNSRTSGNRGCPYCSNNKVWPGFNDIATTHPEIAKSLYKGDPTKLSSGSEKVVEWKCYFPTRRFSREFELFYAPTVQWPRQMEREL